MGVQAPLAVGEWPDGVSGSDTVSCRLSLYSLALASAPSSATSPEPGGGWVVLFGAVGPASEKAGKSWLQMAEEQQGWRQARRLLKTRAQVSVPLQWLPGLVHAGRWRACLQKVWSQYVTEQYGLL